MEESLTFIARNSSVITNQEMYDERSCEWGQIYMFTTLVSEVIVEPVEGQSGLSLA
jgi:hypothetical protein